MEQQQAPAAAGQENPERLRPAEEQALQAILVQLTSRLRVNDQSAPELGQAARRMVLAAFRPS